MKRDNSISKNYFYNFIYKILIVIAPLITTPYISRTLKVEAIGKYSYVTTIMNMLILLGILGTGLYGQRGVAQRRDREKEKSVFFYEIFLIRGIGLSCIAIIYICFSVLNRDNFILFLICGVEIIATIYDISWLYQGDEEFEKVVLRNLVLKVLTIVLIFMWIKNEDDLLRYAAIRSISLMVANLSMWPFKKEHVSRILGEKVNIKKHLKDIAILFIPQVSIQLYSNSDKLMLQWITRQFTENGYYDQAHKIIELCNIFSSALNATMLPRLSYLISKGDEDTYKVLLRKSLKCVLLISLPMGVGIFCIADIFALCFFGEGYGRVGMLLRAFSPFLIISGVNGVICQQYLVLKGKEKTYMKITIFATFINIGCNLFLISAFNALGAVYGTLISEFSILFIALIILARDKILRIGNFTRIAWPYVLSSIIMGIIVKMLSFIVFSHLILLIMQICCGIIVYLVLLLIMREELTMSFIKRFFSSRTK